MRPAEAGPPKDVFFEHCLDEAMKHYPKGTTYRVKHGQSWDAAAYKARRKEIEPLVRAVIIAVSFECARNVAPMLPPLSGGHFVNR